MTVKLDRQALRQHVIQEIEKNFPDSIVIWSATGIPDEDYDDTEQFEALWINDEDYDRFNDFVWNLEKNFANPNGFSIMVHDLNPDDTRKYRREEYEEGQLRKLLNTLKTDDVSIPRYTYVIQRIKINESMSKFLESNHVENYIRSYYILNYPQSSIAYIVTRQPEHQQLKIWEKLSKKTSIKDFLSENDEERKELETYSLAA